MFCLMFNSANIFASSSGVISSLCKSLPSLTMSSLCLANKSPCAKISAYNNLSSFALDLPNLITAFVLRIFQRQHHQLSYLP